MIVHNLYFDGDDRNTLKPPAELATKHLLGVRVPERPNHVQRYDRMTFSAIRQGPSEEIPSGLSEAVIE